VTSGEGAGEAYCEVGGLVKRRLLVEGLLVKQGLLVNWEVLVK
jgi:hypothetical protein